MPIDYFQGIAAIESSTPNKIYFIGNIDACQGFAIFKSLFTNIYNVRYVDACKCASDESTVFYNGYSIRNFNIS
jgi:hypothetical protein